MPFEAEIFVGSVVKTTCEIRSIDRLRVTLDKGCCGKVVKVDEDGDALVKFANLPEIGTSCRWIDKDSFSDLLMLNPKHNLTANSDTRLDSRFETMALCTRLDSRFETMTLRMEVRLANMLQEEFNLNEVRSYNK